jgi:GST-like protein
VIDLYFWPTPNGWKISISLEEMELPYEVIPINIGRGDQHQPEYLALCPNGRMPAIVDHDPLGGGQPLSIFETGAILLYLAEKTGKFCPQDPRGRYDVTQWLMWQMGGLGPMLGQHGHFKVYATETHEYALNRYRTEAERLYGVMNTQLEKRDYLAGDYSIADMACWPWVITYKAQGIDLEQYPHVRRWYDALKQRPGLRRGYDVGKDIRSLMTGGPDDEARKVLFGGAAAKA